MIFNMIRLRLALLILLFPAVLQGQKSLLTVAEGSDFTSTANYQDVMSFISSLKKTSEFIRTETIATSVEGREIPLMVIGNPLPASPQAMKNDNRIVVYIQANIHAGEVEGKEAVLMFARDLLSDPGSEYLKNVVFLLCPNFNPDGNEKISPLNRTYQNGPVNGVGVRYNGQFLDLNRDGMKAESPEVRGVITNVFNRWDPAVFMDCHTTDGSYHVEPVTFTWMVNPAGDTSLISYMRKKMMPAMSATLKSKYKVENCFYGEFNDLSRPENGWFYDASDPRYMSNYFGLRNRLGILNENYVYADYRSRVLGCYNLIRSLADYSSANKSAIRNMLAETDRTTILRGTRPAVTDSFPVEFRVRPLTQPVTIKTYEADVVTGPDGRRTFKRSDRRRDVTVPYYIDYYPSANVRFPFAYIITQNDPSVVELLKVHGIIIEKLSEKTRIISERFDLSELKGSGRLNQGHYTNTISGKFVCDTTDFDAGTLIIRTAQPLANLAAYLLEPQTNDGLMTWNYFDKYLVPQWGAGYYPYPVRRVIERTSLKTVPLK